MYSVRLREIVARSPSAIGPAQGWQAPSGAFDNSTTRKGTARALVAPTGGRIFHLLEQDAHLDLVFLGEVIEGVDELVVPFPGDVLPGQPLNVSATKRVTDIRRREVVPSGLPRGGDQGIPYSRPASHLCRVAHAFWGFVGVYRRTAATPDDQHNGEVLTP